MLKQFLLILATIQLILITNSPSALVSCWTLWPSQYWVRIENGLSKDTMDLHCQMVYGTKLGEDLGLRHMPVEGYFNHTFKTRLTSKTFCRCNVTWPNRGRLTNANFFEDDPSFVDSGCGAHHCTWRPQDDGIYLYNFKKKRFINLGPWDKY
ncbi:hypothetical protein vseg_003869 [Gypsophila vaccaria]